ncbi:uncharacterized protein LOC143915803 [Arctopsyche grandis]|uniref:uncharacterized protein LOC143915803 n=1 Tax=Arctopsyche grandis TaxID=121162 RepID=UPI00406D9E02
MHTLFALYAISQSFRVCRLVRVSGYRIRTQFARIRIALISTRRATLPRPQIRMPWLLDILTHAKDNSASKMSTDSSCHAFSKRKRVCMPLGIKSDIVKRMNAGERPAVLAREYCVPDSTIRCIQKNGDKILNSIKHSSDVTAKVIKRVRNPLLEKTEKALDVWMEEQNQTDEKIPGTVIRQKALELYEMYAKEDEGPKGPFTASKGWLAKFEKRIRTKAVQDPKFSGYSFDECITDEIQTSGESPFARLYLESYSLSSNQNPNEEEETTNSFEMKPNINEIDIQEDNNTIEASEKYVEVYETDDCEERDLFGKYISAALKKMPEEYSISAMNEIQNIITKYKLKSCSKS